METRKKEKFQITMAHTERFNKSAGIQMQHYLNEPR